MQETKTLGVAQIGEHIGMDLGTTMVKSFYDAFPALAFGHTIGKEIMLKMLAQPGCEGLTVFPALNEAGKPTLVLAGVDAKNNVIASFPVVTADGSLEFEEGLIVDRIKTGGWD
jgi:hypothetical protein